MLTRDTLEMLLDLSRQMAETRALNPLLEFAMCEVLDFVGAENGYLIMLDADGELEFRVNHCRSGEEIAHPDQQISRTIFDRVISNGESIVLTDAVENEDYQDAASILDLNLRSVMCVPLIAGGEKLGAIYTENRSAGGVFEGQELQALQYFAAHAAVAIENAILNENLEIRVATRTKELNQTVKELEHEIEARKRAEAELQRLAITDPLTNAYNRRYFFEVADQELERAHRHDLKLSLAMMDLDHFKDINDNYGHVVGDQALRTMAECFRANLRKTDILGRYGGDEFAVLMPATDLKRAQKTAERLRKKLIQALKKTNLFGTKLTVSVGVYAYSAEEEIEIETFVDRADQALYQAKEGGRNQVTIWK
jgi:diguanylate cyclase (GGDEF)-like protein